MNNLKIRSMALFSLCLLVTLSTGLLLKDRILPPIENVATVSEALDAGNSEISKVNSLTKQAENLSKDINSWWTSKSKKEKYKSSLSTVLSERKKLIKEAFLQDLDLNKINKPSNSLSKATSDSTTDRTLIEQRLVLKNATINALHEDNFITGKPSYRYVILADKKQYSLKTGNYIGNVSGKVSTLTGMAFGSELYVSKLDPSEIIKSKPKEGDEGRKGHNTLIILINFQNSLQVPFTKEEVSKLVFDNHESQFDKFMREQSFNNVDFEGRVYGWLTLNKFTDPGSCDIGDSYTDIDSFVTANNINIGDYDHYVRIVNCPTGFGMGGYSSVGKLDIVLGGIAGYASDTTLNVSNSALDPASHLKPFAWNQTEDLLAHEMGHALGLLHSHGWDCGDSQINLPCENIEYGNTFDAMGSGTRFALHNNGYYKHILGWIPDSNVIQVTGSGSYKLSPVELGPPSNPSLPSPAIGKRVAIIRVNGRPVYSIERRESIGFDAQIGKDNNSGFYINKISGNESYLIDSQPSSMGWWDDTGVSMLKKNQVFSDPKSGLVIKAIDSETFEVTITPTGCINLPPIALGLTLYKSFGNDFVKAMIHNTDYAECPNSDIVSEILPSPILSQPNAHTSYDTPPNSGYPIYLPFEVVPNTPPGTYPIEIKITNLTSGLSSIETLNYVVEGPCANFAPAIDNIVAPDSKSYVVTVTNKDTSSCKFSDFNTEIVLPNPILSNAYPNFSPAVDPQTTFTNFVSFEIAPNTPPGIYPIEIRTTNLSSGLSSTQTVNYSLSCIHNKPYLGQALLSGPTTYKFKAANKDDVGCPASDFSTEIVLPNPILSNSTPVTNPSIAPQSSMFGFLEFQVIPNTPPGTYPIEIKSTNTSSGLYDSMTVDYVIP